MSIGTVLGGAALGALAGALLVNPSGTGTFLGSDEQTLVLLTTVGPDSVSSASAGIGMS
jgi:hypothetical protein